MQIRFSLAAYVRRCVIVENRSGVPIELRVVKPFEEGCQTHNIPSGARERIAICPSGYICVSIACQLSEHAAVWVASNVVVRRGYCATIGIENRNVAARLMDVHSRMHPGPRSPRPRSPPWQP